MKKENNNITDAVFQKHKKLMLERLNVKSKLINERYAYTDITFTTTVNVDPRAVGREDLPVQEHIEVEISADAKYEDASFDHEFGTHDPGSYYTVIPKTISCTVTQDYNEVILNKDGKPEETDKKIFEKGDDIDPKWVVSSAEVPKWTLEDLINAELNKES